MLVEPDERNGDARSGDERSGNALVPAPGVTDAGISSGVYEAVR